MSVSKIASSAQKTQAATAANKTTKTNTTNKTTTASKTKETAPKQKSDSVSISKEATETKKTEEAKSSLGLDMEAFKENTGLKEADAKEAFETKEGKITDGDKAEDAAAASKGEKTENAQGQEEEPEPIVISGTEGNDEWNVAQNEDGSMVINVNGIEMTYSAEDAERLVFDLGEGDNSFLADETVMNDLRIKAGDGNNNITGGSGNDSIEFGNGNNMIDGGKGNDNIAGGHGDNIISTGEPKPNSMFANLFGIPQGGDTVNVGDGNNIIVTGDGNNNITAGNGNNTISGGAGNDNIHVGNGDNTVHGGAGNDTLWAGNGHNVIYGGDGDDSISAGTGSNFIDGGAGSDNISIGANSFNSILAGGNNSTNVVLGGEGDDNISIYGGGTNYIDGGAGRDKIKGGSGDDIIYGGAGADSIKGGGGNDTISYGESPHDVTYEQLVNSTPEASGAATGSISSTPVAPENIATQGLNGDVLSVSPELQQYYASRGEEITYDPHPPYGDIPIIQRQDSYGNTFNINANMGPDFDRMMAAAAEAGEPIQVNSGYRTLAEQTALYNDPNYDAAAPGSQWSNHEQGMALDIGNSDGSGGRTWFTNNAVNFNFESFESAYGGTHEPWHFNYNGNQI